jgi:hypothetical protein
VSDTSSVNATSPVVYPLILSTTWSEAACSASASYYEAAVIKEVVPPPHPMTSIPFTGHVDPAKEAVATVQPLQDETLNNVEEQSLCDVEGNEVIEEQDSSECWEMADDYPTTSASVVDGILEELQYYDDNVIEDGGSLHGSSSRHSLPDEAFQKPASSFIASDRHIDMHAFAPTSYGLIVRPSSTLPPRLPPLHLPPVSFPTWNDSLMLPEPLSKYSTSDNMDFIAEPLAHK